MTTPLREELETGKFTILVSGSTEIIPLCIGYSWLSNCATNCAITLASLAHSCWIVTYDCLCCCVVVHLQPGRDTSGAAIALFTANLHNPLKTTHKTTLQGIVYQLDTALLDTETQKAGLVFIYDMSCSKYSNFDYDLSQKILTLLKVSEVIQFNFILLFLKCAMQVRCMCMKLVGLIARELFSFFQCI